MTLVGGLKKRIYNGSIRGWDRWLELNKDKAYIGVSGDFSCNHLGLTSLKGGPEYVGGNFNCSHNNLTSLKYSPKKIKGNFLCCENKIKSLEFCPNIVLGMFDCSENELTSLKFAPKSIGFCGFWCEKNKLTSLEFCPEEIDGDFCFMENYIKELNSDYFPKRIDGDVYSYNNNLDHDCSNDIAIYKYNNIKGSIIIETLLQEKELKIMQGILDNNKIQLNVKKI